MTSRSNVDFILGDFVTDLIRRRADIPTQMISLHHQSDFSPVNDSYTPRPRRFASKIS